MRHALAWLSVVGGLLAAGATEGPPPAPEPAPDKATRAEVRRLQENRREILLAALTAREKLYQAGRVEMSGVVETSK